MNQKGRISCNARSTNAKFRSSLGFKHSTFDCFGILSKEYLRFLILHYPTVELQCVLGSLVHFSWPPSKLNIKSVIPLNQILNSNFFKVIFSCHCTEHILGMSVFFFFLHRNVHLYLVLLSACDT